MRILLISPYSEGTHHSYTLSLEKAFSDLGHEVFHYTQKNEKQEKIRQSIQAFEKDSRYLPGIFLKYFKYIIKSWQLRYEARLRWHSLFNHINNLHRDLNQPDLLFFESLDASMGYYITRRDIDNRLSIPFSGILVCPEDTRLMKRHLLKRGPLDPYNILKSKWCKSVGVVVEESCSFLSTLIHKPVILIPDIISVTETILDNSLGDLIRKRARDRFTIR